MKSDVMRWPEHAYELDEFGATPACDLSGSVITTPVYAITHESTFDTTLCTHASTYMGAKPYDGGLTGVCYTGATAKTYFYLTDRRGTVHAVADESGVVVERYRYDAWGRVLGVYNSSGQVLTESAIGNRLLFQGREYSWKTGFYYFRARWSDPSVGKWLSPDPVRLVGGINNYAMMGNNCINFRDAFGLCSQWNYSSPQLDWLRSWNSINSEQEYAAWYFFGQAGADKATAMALYQAALVADFGLTTAISEYLGLAGMFGLSRSLGLIGSAQEATLLETTVHGASRLAGEAATRGGVLTIEGAQAVMNTGRTMMQADGATVSILEVGAGRFNVVVSGSRGIITTFERISLKSLTRLGANYGWH